MSTNDHTDAADDFALLPRAFATVLRMEAGRADLRQKELIELTGLSKGAIGSYWKGTTTPNLKGMAMLAHALGMSTVDFYALIMAEHARIAAE